MSKCPKCQAEIKNHVKEWKYGIFTVKMYKCPCNNQFREYIKEGQVRFILSAHNGGLGPRIKSKKENSTQIK